MDPWNAPGQADTVKVAAQLAPPPPPSELVVTVTVLDTDEVLPAASRARTLEPG